MRFVYVVIDYSSAMLDQALFPSLINVSVKHLKHFVQNFFQLNPIAQLGLILCTDRKPSRLVSFTSNSSFRDSVYFNFCFRRLKGVGWSIGQFGFCRMCRWIFVTKLAQHGITGFTVSLFLSDRLIQMFLEVSRVMPVAKFLSLWAVCRQSIQATSSQQSRLTVCGRLD